LHDLYHHAVGWAGAISTVLTFLPQHALDKISVLLTKKRLLIATVIFLYIGTYQVWMDERNNVNQLAAEKSSIYSESDFWKSQSYSKDDTIRTKDSLLETNYTVLLNTQSSLATLSNNILDAGKPQPLKITQFFLNLGASDNDKTAYRQQFLLLTNRTITPVRLLATCDKEIDLAGSGVLGTKSAMLGDTWSGKRSANTYAIGLVSPAWSPTGPLIVSVYFNDPAQRTCSFDEQ
jgi:hypothetical protein